MKVLEVFDAAGVRSVRVAERQKPGVKPGQVLIEVEAAGVTPTELLWYPTDHTVDGKVRVGAVPGHEFSGRIAALGAGVVGWALGDAVYGMNGWFDDGAMAAYCVTTPAQIAAMPQNLSFVQAATVPISALTAWQGLFEKGRLKPGERVLIHGGAGAVGMYAVQLARHHGAYCATTASGTDEELLARLGADQVIDYRTTRYEEVGGRFNLVFDCVGGQTLERSFAVLNPGGRVVTIAASAEAEREGRVKDAFFIVEPRVKELEAVRTMIEQERLLTFVKADVPMEDGAEAFRGRVTGTGRGKVVIVVRTQ